MTKEPIRDCSGAVSVLSKTTYWPAAVMFMWWPGLADAEDHDMFPFGDQVRPFPMYRQA